MKVKLKRGWSHTYPELTIGNVYRVLAISNESLRIISDAGEPILFNARAFEVVDPRRPANWIEERGEDGELYASPPELSEPRHFFEAFFDYDMRVRQRFHNYVHELCHEESESIPDPPNRYVRSSSTSVTSYVELDEEGAEVRRVDLFADGRVTYAWAKGSTGTTILNERSVDATATAVSREEFEHVWNQALDSPDP